MGQAMDKPDTSKILDAAAGNGVACAVASMQGWRREMEDAHLCRVGLPSHPECSLFGVFDGHGGATVAEFSASDLLLVLSKTPGYPTAKTAQEWSEVLYRGFLRLDTHLKKNVVRDTDDHSGCTAVVALVTPTDILVANAGDSRCVLCRGGRTIDMSEDHKPDKESERKRIKKAGGRVDLGRVNGELAVSRALGDFEYKMHADLGQEAQLVTAAPDVRSMPRHSTDEFLILACDGVWDVMSSKDAITYIRDRLPRLFLLRPGGAGAGGGGGSGGGGGRGFLGALTGGGSASSSAAAGGMTTSVLEVEGLPRCDALQRVMGEMLDHCLTAGSRDNMTASIVVLPGAASAAGIDYVVPRAPPAPASLPPTASTPASLGIRVPGSSTAAVKPSPLASRAAAAAAATTTMSSGTATSGVTSPLVTPRANGAVGGQVVASSLSSSSSSMAVPLPGSVASGPGLAGTRGLGGRVGPSSQPSPAPGSHTFSFAPGGSPLGEVVTPSVTPSASPPMLGGPPPTLPSLPGSIAAVGRGVVSERRLGLGPAASGPLPGAGASLYASSVSSKLARAVAAGEAEDLGDEFDDTEGRSASGDLEAVTSGPLSAAGAAGGTGGGGGGGGGRVRRNMQRRPFRARVKPKGGAAENETRGAGGGRVRGSPSSPLVADEVGTASSPSTPRPSGDLDGAPSTSPLQGFSPESSPPRPAHPSSSSSTATVSGALAAISSGRDTPLLSSPRPDPTPSMGTVGGAIFASATNFPGAAGSSATHFATVEGGDASPIPTPSGASSGHRRQPSGSLVSDEGSARMATAANTTGRPVAGWASDLAERSRPVSPPLAAPGPALASSNATSPAFERPAWLQSGAGAFSPPSPTLAGLSGAGAASALPSGTSGAGTTGTRRPAPGGRGASSRSLLVTDTSTGGSGTDLAPSPMNIGGGNGGIGTASATGGGGGGGGNVGAAGTDVLVAEVAVNAFSLEVDDARPPPLIKSFTPGPLAPSALQRRALDRRAEQSVTSFHARMEAYEAEERYSSGGGNGRAAFDGAGPSGSLSARRRPESAAPVSSSSYTGGVGLGGIQAVNSGVSASGEVVSSSVGNGGGGGGGGGGGVHAGRPTGRSLAVGAERRHEALSDHDAEVFAHDGPGARVGERDRAGVGGRDRGRTGSGEEGDDDENEWRRPTSGRPRVQTSDDASSMGGFRILSLRGSGDTASDDAVAPAGRSPRTPNWRHGVVSAGNHGPGGAATDGAGIPGADGWGGGGGSMNGAPPGGRLVSRQGRRTTAAVGPGPVSPATGPVALFLGARSHVHMPAQPALNGASGTAGSGATASSAGTTPVVGRVGGEAHGFGTVRGVDLDESGIEGWLPSSQSSLSSADATSDGPVGFSRDSAPSSGGSSAPSSGRSAVAPSSGPGLAGSGVADALDLFTHAPEPPTTTPILPASTTSGIAGGPAAGRARVPSARIRAATTDAVGVGLGFPATPSSSSSSSSSTVPGALPGINPAPSGSNSSSSGSSSASSSSGPASRTLASRSSSESVTDPSEMMRPQPAGRARAGTSSSTATATPPTGPAPAPTSLLRPGVVAMESLRAAEQSGRNAISFDAKRLRERLQGGPGSVGSGRPGSGSRDGWASSPAVPSAASIGTTPLLAPLTVSSAAGPLVSGRPIEASGGGGGGGTGAMSAMVSASLARGSGSHSMPTGPLSRPGSGRYAAGSTSAPAVSDGLNYGGGGGGGGGGRDGGGGGGGGGSAATALPSRGLRDFDAGRPALPPTVSSSSSGAARTGASLGLPGARYDPAPSHSSGAAGGWAPAAGSHASHHAAPLSVPAGMRPGHVSGGPASVGSGGVGGFLVGASGSTGPGAPTAANVARFQSTMSSTELRSLLRR